LIHSFKMKWFEYAFDDKIRLTTVIFTSDYSNKMFRELQSSLYVVSNYKRCQTDEFSVGVYKQIAMWRIRCLEEACSRHEAATTTKARSSMEECRVAGMVVRMMLPGSSPVDALTQQCRQFKSNLIWPSGSRSLQWSWRKSGVMTCARVCRRWISDELQRSLSPPATDWAGRQPEWRFKLRLTSQFSLWKPFRFVDTASIQCQIRQQWAWVVVYNNGRYHRRCLSGKG